MNFNINTEAFLSTLPYMGKGMLGIFVVTLVIIVSIMILNKVGSND
jgi:hypothetical protein